MTDEEYRTAVNGAKLGMALVIMRDIVPPYGIGYEEHREVITILRNVFIRHIEDMTARLNKPKETK